MGGRHDGNIVAQHSSEGALTPGEALRELLHDATEFMLGWDCITPLKARLGEPLRALETRLQSAIDTRYQLPEWTPEAYAIHTRADRLAAASEAFHVVGWSRVDMRKTPRVAEVPLLQDPLSPCGFAPWEPWPAHVAQRLFIERDRQLREPRDDQRRAAQAHRGQRLVRQRAAGRSLLLRALVRPFGGCHKDEVSCARSNRYH
jgi:hypothetical protein